MPVVSLPNGTELEFPDGMAESAMRDAIYRNFPEYAPKTASGVRASDAEIDQLASAQAEQDAAAGRVVDTPRRESVLEGVTMPETGIDTAESIRMSRRAYAEANDPARQPPAQTARPGEADAVRPTGEGIVGRAGDLIKAQTYGAAAGLGRMLASGADIVGAEGLADNLNARARTASAIKQRLGQGVELERAGRVGDQVEGFAPRSIVQDSKRFADEYLPQILAQSPQLPMAMFGGLAPLVGISYLSSYADARDAGRSPAEALAYAVPQASAEYIGERLGGMGKLNEAFEAAMASGFARDAAWRDLGRAFMAAGAKEVPSEELTYGLQFINDKFSPVGLQPGATWEDFKKGAADTAIVALGAGGMMGGAGALISRAAGPQPAPEIPAELRSAASQELPVTAPMEIIAPAQTTDEAIKAAAEALDMGTQSAEAVANIGRILEQANVSTPTAIPAVDTGATGSGSPDAAPSLDSGMGADGALAGPAVEPAGPADTPASAAVPQGAADPLATLRDENAALRSQALQALQAEPSPVAPAQPVQPAGSAGAQGLPAAGPAALETGGVAAAPRTTPQPAPALAPQPVAPQEAPVSGPAAAPAQAVIQPNPAGAPLTPEQQRADFKATEAKRAAKDARLRSAAFDKNPLMAFLGKHGVSSALASEFAPGPTERRKAIVPGYGPVFRKAGLNLDALAERAAEEGFLPPGSRDADALYALIQRAMRGQRVMPQYAEGAVEQQAEAELAARYEDYLDNDALAPADLEPALAAVDPALQAEVRALLAQAESEGIDTEAVLERVAIKAQNGTQDEFNRQAIADLSAARDSRQGAADRDGGQGRRQETEPEGRGDRGPDSGAARAEAGAEPQDSGLTAPTRAEVLAQQDRAAQADELDQREQVRRESEAGAGLFSLTQEDGRQDTTGSLFDQPAEPAVERFEIGKSLTKEQRKQVLSTLIDVYKAKGAPREQKGVGRDGNERSGYAYSPDLFEKSDITGAMVRYYVTLPDGRIAHPSELFPDLSTADVESMAAEQAREQEKAAAYENAIKPFYSDYADAELRAGKDQTVISKGDQFAVIPDSWGAVKQAESNGWQVSQRPAAEKPISQMSAADLLRAAADKMEGKAETIQDLGEKIGGARKDTAQPTGRAPRKSAETDNRPTWAKRFQITEIVAGNDEGRWVIRDTRSLDWRKMPKQVGRTTFESREAAERALPLLAVSMKHRVVPVNVSRPKTEAEVDAMLKADMAAKAEDENRPGKIEAMVMGNARRKLAAGEITQAQFDTISEKYAEAAAKYTPPAARAEQAEPSQAWEIWRDISDRKRVKVVDLQFSSRDDAMRYMAENATAIMEANTTFGEADLPVPEDKRRDGPQRRQGDVTGQDFMQTFGFRGVEFGNWNNQAERQELMNEAYDGLMDLAEVMQIPPKAISLNGDLALAFGARGHGLSGARAHYEPDRAVMNLTKMKGAGALAHEWFHALDHYFGRQDGKAPVTWVTNLDGTRSLKVNSTSEDNYVTSGFSRRDSGVREEVREAYLELMDTMMRKAEKYVQDTAKVEQFVSSVRDNVETRLAGIRRDLAEQKDVRYYKRNNKPASAEQLAEFDDIARQIIEGTALETELRPSSTKTLTGMRWSNDHLEKLSAIYKAVRGRTGFDAEQNGVLDRLRQEMGLYSARLKMLAEAQAGEEKTKKVPTDFAMDAKSLDQGRGTDYWITPHEMAARAFQGYVEDKIAQRGGKSPFLNYGPENVGILTPWGAKRPYPAGEERKAINRAFDKLVDVIQTREDEFGNVAMFARSGEDVTETPEFKRWFGDSKVVDAQGKPLVVYHGAAKSFNVFKPSKQGTYGPGIYFANSKASAESYLPGVSGSETVIEAYVSLQNPWVVKGEFDSPGAYAEDVDSPIIEAVLALPKGRSIIDAARKSGTLTKFAHFGPELQKHLKELGHDGIISDYDDGSMEIIAFRPEQIKSAIGNRGTFDPANPDIRYSRAPAQTGMPIDAVRAIADRIAAKWTAGPSITVVQTAADLPVDNAPADAAGLMLRGRVYLVASNLENARKVQEALAHEAIAHHGLREMLGRDGWKQMMANIQMARKAGNKTIREISDDVRRRYVDDAGNFNLTETQEADEIAARAVEMAIDPETGEFRPGLGFLKSVWSKVADFLRRIGIDVQFTNAELQGLLVRAMWQMETGKKTEAMPEAVPAYALADGNPEQKALRALSENDDLFALPKSDKTSVEGIAADNDPGIQVRQTKIGNETLYVLTMPNGTTAKLWVRPANPYGDQIYSMDLVDGDTSNVEVGRPGENPEDVDPDIEDVYIDVSNLKPGQDGNKVYNIAATFAHNTGRIFIGDPSGLTDSAMRRRLENMISTALKFGTTDHIAPHPRQVKGGAGVPPLKWVYGDSLGNIRRMIDASLKAADNAGKPKFSYDPSTGILRDGQGNLLPASPDRTGNRLPGAALAGNARNDGSGLPGVSGALEAGWRTPAREAVFRALLREISEEVTGTGLDRRGLLARLVQVANQYPAATYKAFYSRTGVGAPGRTAATPQQNSPWRDATGRLQFAPGQWLYDKIGQATGPLLNWKYLQLKAASPELRRMLRDMKLQVERAQETAAAVAGEAFKLTDAERAMVSDLVEKEVQAGVQPPAHAVRLAAMINDAMGKQTDELIRLGMLTTETAEKWRGQYLPRYYESKLGKKIQDVWADSIGKMFATPRTAQGIRGKHLRGRGMYQTIPESQLADYEALGWEVRDPDYQPGLATMDGTVQVWRDFTRQERDKMGEIRDAGFRFVMGYMQTQKDIALGRLYEAMASNPEMSSRTETAKFSAQVPDSKVPGTGAKTYGKMAGRWVSPETLSQLSRAGEEGNEALMMYRKAMSYWKQGKTSMNPVSHANNVISNVTMAHMAGVSYWRPDLYTGAIKDLVTKAPMVKEAKEAGLFLGSMSEAELMNTMPAELRALAGKQDGAAAKAGKTVWDMMTFWLSTPMGKAYQAEDSFFRYLIYRDARGRGMEPTDAVDYAQRYIFTYDDLPKGARMIRDFGMPFFAYTYKAIPALLHTALTHPDRMLAPAAVLWTINAAAYAIAAGDDDESWDIALKRYLNDPEFRAKVRETEEMERRYLPEWMKGTTALMTPKVIRLGMDEATNLPLFLDMSRMMPGGDLFDVNPNAGGIPLPQPMTPNHPFFTLATGLLANKDLFRGNELTDSNDTSEEKAAKRADWLWKQLSPAIAVNNYHWERWMNAIAQANGGEVKYVPDALGGDSTGVGRDGLPIQPKLAALQTVGIKLRPIDLETSELIDLNMQRKMVRDIDAEVRRMRRLAGKGAISMKTLETEMEKAAEKKGRLREGLTVDGDERN